MPLAFGLFYAKIGKLDKELTLPPESVLLIREPARFQDTDTKQSCLSAL